MSTDIRNLSTDSINATICEEFCDRLRELIEESPDDEKQVRFLQACISAALNGEF